MMVFPPPEEVDMLHVFHGVKGNWARFENKNIFFTGGTGFIGKNLLSSLGYAIEKMGLNCAVTVLSRDPSGFFRSAPFLENRPWINWRKGNVSDFEFPKQSFDYVIHAATDVATGTGALETFDVCSAGTRRVLDFSVACGAERFLLMSSGAVYGRSNGKDERFSEKMSGRLSILDERSAYGLGKIASEWLTVQYARQYGFHVGIARCFAFLGPYLPMDKHFAIGNFIRDVVEKRDIVIAGDGSPRRTYMYTADLSLWLLTILLEGETCAAYNVGGDEEVSIRELARIVNKSLNGNAQILCKGSTFSDAPVDLYVPDVSLAKKTLNLSVKINLEESIRKTWRWYRDFLGNGKVN